MTVPNRETRQYDNIPIHHPVNLGSRPPVIGLLTSDMAAPTNGLTDPEFATMSVWTAIPGTSGPVEYEDSGAEITLVNRDRSLSGETGNFVKAERINGEWQPYYLGCAVGMGGGGGSTTSSTTTGSTTTGSTTTPSTTTPSTTTPSTTTASTTTSSTTTTSTTTTTTLPACNYDIFCDAGGTDTYQCHEINGPCAFDADNLALCTGNSHYGDPCIGCDESELGVCCLAGACLDVDCATCESMGGWWLEGPASCPEGTPTGCE